MQECYLDTWTRLVVISEGLRRPRIRHECNSGTSLEKKLHVCMHVCVHVKQEDSGSHLTLSQMVHTIAHATVLATGKNTSLLGMLEVEVLIQMID